MPVLINSEGLAVDIPKGQEQQALSNGHYVPLIGPDGSHESAPVEHASELLSQGYKQPSSEQLSELLKYAKHSSGVEQAKTFAEGAASAATLGLSSGVEGAVLGNQQEQLDRRETNPGVHATGQVAGVLGSLAIPGAGATGLATRAGEAAASSVAHRLGSRITKEAVEGAIFQGGDEVSKALLGDPNQSLESVVSNLGISTLLSGGVGGAFHAGEKITAPLWKAAEGSALASTLSKIKDRVQGVTGANAIDDTAKAAGIELSPEMRATLGTDHGSRMGQELRESATPSGRAYEKELEAFHQDASDQVISALGKDAKAVQEVANASEYEQGLHIKETLTKDLEQRLAPISKEYDRIKSKVAGREVDFDSLASLSDRLGKVAIDSGAVVRPGSDEARLMSSIIKDIPNIKTLSDLEAFQSSVGADLQAKQMFGLKGKVMSVLRDAEEQAITTSLGDAAPDLLERYAFARKGYREFMDVVDTVADRLRPGKYSGPKGFLNNLKEMAPEDVVKRLKGAGDVDLQTHLATNFPGVSAAIKDVHLSSILKKAVNAPRAIEGGIDTRVLFKQLDNLSPELRASLFTPEQQQKLTSLKDLLEKLPERLNPSGTSRAIDAKFADMGGAYAILGSLLTGGPAGAILGYMGQKLKRDAPDAIKLALLKVLGTEGPVDAVALKGLVNFTNAAYKAAAQTDRVVRSILKPGAIRLVTPLSPQRIAALDKQLEDTQLAPETAMEKMSDFTSYLPDQAAAAGALTAQAMAYLTSLRPKTGGNSPLDPKQPANAVATAKYHRALQVTEQPLLVLQGIKDGTLTKDDVVTLGACYPNLYKSYQQKLMAQITEAKAKKQVIPYKSVIAMSMFLQMPLESSTLPYNMLHNQLVSTPQPEQQAPVGQPRVKQGPSGTLSKLPSSSTPSQARAQDRLTQ